MSLIESNLSESIEIVFVILNSKDETKYTMSYFRRAAILIY